MFEKFIKECLFIALLLFLIFIMENYNYYFHFLPHREDYIFVDAHKGMYGWGKTHTIYVFFRDGENTVTAKIVQDAHDADRDTIRVAYSRVRRPNVIRADFAVKKELYAIGILVILLQIRRFFYLKKYWKDLIQYPK